MAIDFSVDEEFQEQLDWMRTFVDEEIEPLELFYDDMSATNWKKAIAPLKQQVRDRGLWACHLDPELGGQGFGQVKLALMHEILGRCSTAPNVFGNQAPDSGNSELIAIGATPYQRETWLEPLLRGDITSSFSLTEPHYSGSDPTMINTHAERDGDEYVINGHKWFASNASNADFILVMAVTNPDNPPHKAASFFIVPKGTPGLNIVRNVFNMHHPYPGHFRSGGHAEILFENCRVPVENRVGNEGDGFRYIIDSWNAERILIASEALGDGYWFTDKASAYASQREVFGRPIGANQGVQFPIALSYAHLEAARMVRDRAAELFDAEQPCGAEANMAKLLAADASWEAANACLNTYGGAGFDTEADVERKFRETRLWSIAPVNNNLVLAFIGQRVLGMPRSY